jgi:nitrous-oxide reductase
MKNKIIAAIAMIFLGSSVFISCKPKSSDDAVSGDDAQKA